MCSSACRPSAHEGLPLHSRAGPAAAGVDFKSLPGQGPGRCTGADGPLRPAGATGIRVRAIGAPDSRFGGSAMIRA